MPYQITGFVAPQLVEVVVYGNATLDDFEGVCQALIDSINQADAAEVHVMIDIAQVKTINYRMDDLLRSAAFMALATHPKLGYLTYFDDKNPFYNMMVEILLHGGKLRGGVFSHREDALFFLKEHGVAIPNL